MKTACANGLILRLKRAFAFSLRQLAIRAGLSSLHAAGGIVYQRCYRTDGLCVLEGGVDGLICVKYRAGGDAGTKSPEQLFAEMIAARRAADLRGGIESPNRNRERTQKLVTRVFNAIGDAIYCIYEMHGTCRLQTRHYSN